jgi:hypothetical protein
MIPGFYGPVLCFDERLFDGLDKPGYWTASLSFPFFFSFSDTPHFRYLYPPDYLHLPLSTVVNSPKHHIYHTSSTQITFTDGHDRL